MSVLAIIEQGAKRKLKDPDSGGAFDRCPVDHATPYILCSACRLELGASIIPPQVNAGKAGKSSQGLSTLTAYALMPQSCQGQSKFSFEIVTVRFPPQPRLLADDVTPEKLASVLTDHGRMGIITPEPDIFELVTG
jgi:hypothetical protein